MKNKDHLFDLKREVFEFVYLCALTDATRQNAFEGEKKWMETIPEAKELLREYIDRLLNDEFADKQDHEAFFLILTNSVCKAINDRKPENAKDSFSFGNAQKLINMTVKYFYSMCYHNLEMRTVFQYCHCPMDSIMLQDVWKKVGEKQGTAARRKNLTSYKEFLKPWSKEGMENGDQTTLDRFPDRYVLFQKAVKELIGDEDIYPIEYDFLFWGK